MKKHFGTLLKSTISVVVICSILFVGSRITNTNDNQTVVSVPSNLAQEKVKDINLYAGITKKIHETTSIPNPIKKEEIKEEIVTASNTDTTKEEIKEEIQVKENHVKEKKIEPITNYTSTGVNLRKAPSTESEIIRVLPRNTDVIKVAVTKDWSRVEYIYAITQQEGICSDVGYIHNDYLSEEKLTNRWNITLTEDEIVLLEKITWREAGNQSLKGQEAVVEVILNRMASEKYPNNLYDVLSQPGQFASWSVRNVGTPTESVKKAVQEVLNGNTNILSNDYLYFSRGGHARHNGMIKIEDHQFCPIG